MTEKTDPIQLAKEVLLKLESPDQAKYEGILNKLDIEYFRQFDFLPDMMMAVSRFTVKETFEETVGDDGREETFISFSFTNLFNAPNGQESRMIARTAGDVPPSLLIFSSSVKQKMQYRKGTHLRHIMIWANRDYLFRFLKGDAASFDFLFTGQRSFFMDEILTDDLLRIVNDIIAPRPSEVLEDFYYKLKAIELLFALFVSLKSRAKAKPLPITEASLEAIYCVRNKIISSLTNFPPVKELTKIAGMNELKLRRMFTQVFGKGLYDYFQHFRMLEAARLLREEKLSVSEVGYRLGFENLSHFSRAFKQCTGYLPHHYAKVLGE